MSEVSRDGSPGGMAGATAVDPSALRWLVLSFGVIVLDQVTKALIVARFELFERIEALPILEITRLHNRGAAFSFLANASGWQHYFFVGLASLVSVGIVWWLSRLRFGADRLLALGLALILGGAVGNVIDRLMHGHVIDFIHFHWRQQWYFPAFNFADTAITIGAALLILDSFLETRRAPRPADAGGNG
ncbi:MAG: signal peptidase II [Steroidobacteraceae bacterium]|nr:signal peptidase II [Steroidobacteraceae bacterium]